MFDPSSLRYHVDEFAVFRNFAFVRGWCELCPGLVLSLADAGGRVFETNFVKADRPDVGKVFGADAVNWGFELRSILPVSYHCEEPKGIVLRLSCGALSVTSPPLCDLIAQASVATMTNSFDDFLAKVTAAPGARVLEIGSRTRSETKVRDALQSANYTGFDIVEGQNVDVVGDVHFLSQHVKGPFDFVFSLSTFEHLIMPLLATLEINKVLSPGGLVFTHSHQAWPIHDSPWDFFRFSADAWRGLFNSATGYAICKTFLAEPGACVPVVNSGSKALVGLDREVCYLASGCIAQKIGSPDMRFEIDRSVFNSVLGSTPYPG